MITSREVVTMPVGSRGPGGVDADDCHPPLIDPELPARAAEAESNAAAMPGWREDHTVIRGCQLSEGNLAMVIPPAAALSGS